MGSSATLLCGRRSVDADAPPGSGFVPRPEGAILRRRAKAQRRGDIMSARAYLAVSTFVCSLGIAAALVGTAAAQSSRPLVSEAQFEAWQKELSNWGRWGNDDQLGTLNLVTPA